MNASIHAVAARVKVCTLKTARWQAAGLHKRETKKVNDDHHTGDAAKVRVRVCDHAALTELQNLHSEAYEYHTMITRPSVDDGVRLLPMCREMEHAAKMNEYKAKHDAIVARFLADYDNERQQAPIRLNGLYDPAMWPDLERVGKKFRFETSYRPCPTEGAWEAWLAISVEAAQMELQEQLGGTEARRGTVRD